MPLFLDTTGRNTLAIGICDRCRRKFPLEELWSDPNSPGLKVCREDADKLDPYRLPPRKADNITVPFVRPDESVATNPAGLISEDGDSFLIDESDESYLQNE